jgi:cysteine sulfinate desulfinase/cysteine desulfurase-like protein
MREILGGEIIGVAPDGTHSFPHHLDRFGFQYVNHEIGLRCDVNEIQSFAGTLIVDASETIGREHYKPEHITIARASAWAGPANSCFIIDPRNQLGLDEKHFIPLQLDSMLLNFAVVSWEINVDSINRRYEINQNNLDLLIEGLTQFPDITVHTPRAFQQRASHLLSFSIKECDSEYAAELYDSYGIAIGSQSACMANSGQPSEVLQALGIETAGHLRLSLPLETTTLEVERFLETTTEVLEKVKQERRFSAE